MPGGRLLGSVSFWADAKLERVAAATRREVNNMVDAAVID
jgi:hypothetical protein